MFRSTLEINRHLFIGNFCEGLLSPAEPGFFIHLLSSNLKGRTGLLDYHDEPLCRRVECFLQLPLVVPEILGKEICQWVVLGKLSLHTCFGFLQVHFWEVVIDNNQELVILDRKYDFRMNVSYDMVAATNSLRSVSVSVV